MLKDVQVVVVYRCFIKVHDAVISAIFSKKAVISIHCMPSQVFTVRSKHHEPFLFNIAVHAFELPVDNLSLNNFIRVSILS